MGPTRAPPRFAFRWLVVLTVPTLWCLASQFGWLEFFENRTIDWRFRARGEIDTPVNVVYVDVDALSLREIGGWPWNRSYFSRVTAALIKEGGVKAVGLDFIFSDLGISETVDLKRLVAGNVEFGRFLLKAGQEPPVVLTAAYAERRFLDENGQERERVLPLVATDRRPREKLEGPELPAFKRNANPADLAFFNPPFIGLGDTMANGTRTVPAWAPNATGRNYFHLGFELARLYWGLPPGALQVRGDRIDFVRADGSVHASTPLRAGQLVDVNWFTRWQSKHSAHVEFSTVFKYAEALTSDEPEIRRAGREFFAQPDFKGAVVLIGPVDALFQDLAPTSLDVRSVPRVGVHGNLLKTIVSGRYLRSLPTWRGMPWSEFALVFGLTVLASVLVTIGGRKGVGATVLAAAALIAYLLLAFWTFGARDVVLPVVAPLGAALTTSFAVVLGQFFVEEHQKRRIQRMFGAYVSPQLVERLVQSHQDPQLGGHDAEITAFFSDIQGFSTYSELLGSGPLFALMNEYLTACTDIVQDAGGTLDKYVGDAVVAMFGAPIAQSDHALRACVAAQRVQLKLGELRARWAAEGARWPELVHRLQSRIGLNSGVCMVGNMGSRVRFNYTMMGDNVNLAARMESGAKHWGVYTLCTDATRTACEQHGSAQLVFRSLGRIVVQGRKQAVPVFEIVGLRENVGTRTQECLGLFAQGLEKYHAGDWVGAQEFFARSRELEFNRPGLTPGVSTNPSLVYLEIAARYEAAPPPADWDGVFVMKEK